GCPARRGTSKRQPWSISVSRGGYGMSPTQRIMPPAGSTGLVVDLVRVVLPLHERAGLESGTHLPHRQLPLLAWLGEQLVQRAVVEARSRRVVPIGRIHHPVDARPQRRGQTQRARLAGADQRAAGQAARKSGGQG